LLVTAALASAAVTGRSIGKPTWWLGTPSDPAFALLWVVPFLAPIAALVAALVAGRWAPFAGMGAALYIGAIALVDIEATPAVALIEVVVAIAAFLVSVASLAGRRSTR
jgi:membrane-bound ClpP family serine protease